MITLTSNRMVNGMSDEIYIEGMYMHEIIFFDKGQIICKINKGYIPCMLNKDDIHSDTVPLNALIVSYIKNANDLRLHRRGHFYSFSINSKLFLYVGKQSDYHIDLYNRQIEGNTEYTIWKLYGKWLIKPEYFVTKRKLNSLIRKNKR